jgi:ankyrin repeat protein
MTSLHRSKQEAKKLLRLVRSGDPQAVKRIAAALDAAGRRKPDVQLADAQFAVARERGFPSWTALKQAAEAERSKPLDKELVREWIFAAERGDLPALERLFEAEPRLVDALGHGPYWEGEARALHYAVARGHRKVIRWLLARGASALPTTGEFDWAPIHFAAVPPRRDLVRLLIDHGAKMDIFVSAIFGDVKTVRRMLRDNPALVSKRGPDGATPLHFAGSPAVAKALLAAGADPRVRDTFHDQTPAEWTIDRPDVVAVLAKAGADVDIHLASAMGDLRRVRALLLRAPNAINTRVTAKKKTIGAEGETPLGLAARYGQKRVVEFLLERGALARTDPSPLPGAVHRRDRIIVKRLLDAGADPNVFGPYGHAALHAAAVYGNLAMIRLLLSAGARLDLKDKDHDSTPLGWAEYHKHERAVRFLKAQGAV